MNPLDVRAARRAALNRQTQILYKQDRHGRQVYDEDLNPVLDLDRAPSVLEALGVPLRLTGATFASSDFEEVDRVREWFQGLQTGGEERYLAVVIGPGSNYIAAAIARNSVKRGLTVRWVSWHDFTRRYTDSITRDRLLDRSSPEEREEAAYDTVQALGEEDRLRHVYDLLVITDFDIVDLRDFAVPDIRSIFRERSDRGLMTVITAATADAGPLEATNPTASFGARGTLLRQLEEEAAVFDGRQ